MNIRYCLPVIKKNKKEVLLDLKIKGYHFYEIWLDYIEDPDDEFLLQIAEKYENKLIFLFRRQNLEKIKLPFQRRKKIISLLSAFNVFFDFDFLSQQKELKEIRSKSMKLIVSYHNYRKTPDLNFLKQIAGRMKLYNPDIIKFSTYCKYEKDAFTLLDLLIYLKVQKLKYIVLGMGEKGVITRILGSMLGNEFTFAPDKLEEKSATGQLSREQMEGIFSKIQ